jgi:hypothetical protein
VPNFFPTIFTPLIMGNWLSMSHIPSYPQSTLPWSTEDTTHIIVQQYITVYTDDSVIETWQFESCIHIQPICIGKQVALYHTGTEACCPDHRPGAVAEGWIETVDRWERDHITFLVKDWRNGEQALLVVPQLLANLSILQMIVHKFSRYWCIPAATPQPLRDPTIHATPFQAYKPPAPSHQEKSIWYDNKLYSTTAHTESSHISLYQLISACHSFLI